jgi:signal transduction histidine kinase
VELAGRHHGWFTDYRRYPVFSRPWLRGRLLRLLGLHAALILLAALAIAFMPATETRPWAGLAEVLVNWLWLLLLGPALAGAVRRRHWPAQREWWALCAVVAAMVLADQAFNRWAAEPLKQAVSEALGQVGPDGKRKRVVVMVGVTLGAHDEDHNRPNGRPGLPSDAAASGPTGAPSMAGGADRPQPDALQVSNLLTRAAIAFVLSGGLGLMAWRRERAGLQALAAERALAEAQAMRREAELRLSVLAAQVEPHFLFNTLAGVRSAINSDPARASVMIDHLVEYLRAAIPRLRSDGTAQATVGAQFDTLRAYLGLMAARMPRLSWQVEASDALLAAQCPPLMLISLVENAVKHGVEPKRGPAHIRVTATRTEDGRLALTVEDDGVGFGHSAAGTGLGLANVRERLAQLHGAQGSLTLRARPEGGVSATLTVPLEFAGPEASAAPR